MIARVTRGSSGVSDYLEKGQKKESVYDRNFKDKVNVLYGSLSTLRATEKYLNKYKQYKDNYLHITLSFSKEDTKRLNELNEEDRQELKQELVKEYIRHHTSGYDIDKEVIAYAEEHQAKLKQEYSYKDKQLKERYDHIHIVIMLHNPLNDTKLRTTFAKTTYIDDVLQSYVNKKYNLTQPRESKRERHGINSKSKIALTRKELLQELKDIKSHSELIAYFKEHNLQYKEVKTKNNHYYKIINNKGKDINLRGRGFEHLQRLTIDKSFKFNEDKGQEELKQILENYYKKRFSLIDARRSKKTKQKLENIYNDKQSQENSIQASYQQKIFYKYYQEYIKDDLKGFFIDTKKKEEVKFINKAKDIQVVDKGDKIIGLGKNTAEQVKLMLDIAEAKKWKLETLVVNGNEAFKKEARKQIAERIRAKQEQEQKEDIKIERPTTPVEQIKVNLDEAQEQKRADADISIKELKEKLKASEVLAYAVSKYDLKADDYELTSDNKINNKTNRQKPKNVIDFLQKELHIKTSEAIDICKELYTKQPLDIKADKDKELEAMGMKISICKDKNINALNNWEQVEVKSYSELATLMKTYPYSMAEFEGTRSIDNTKGFNNVLIYDIDNDGENKLSLEEAKQLLKQHGISAMIIPSKSHQIEKFTKSGKSKGVEDRFRIVIPTNRGANLQTKEEFREFQEVTAKALQLDKYLDRQALNDKARFYYKSPVTAEPHIIKADRVMNIDKLEAKALENVEKRAEEKRAEEQRIDTIRRNLEQYRAKPTQASTGNNLTFANVERIINEIDIKQLIKHYERAEEYKEGNYTMMKSDTAKYSIIGSNIAHDFKSDVTYNPLTYLQQKIGTTNLNRIAREAQKITGDKYIEVNIDAVNKAVKKSLERATNDKTFEQGIREFFDVDFVRFEGDKLRIADEVIEVNKDAVIGKLKENREIVQRAEQEHSYGMTR